MDYKLILKHISKYDSSITYSGNHISQPQNLPQERFTFYKETETHFIFAKMVSSLQSLPYYQVIFNTFTTKEELAAFLKSNGISEVLRSSRTKTSLYITCHMKHFHC